MKTCEKMKHLLRLHAVSLGSKELMDAVGCATLASIIATNGNDKTAFVNVSNDQELDNQTQNSAVKPTTGYITYITNRYIAKTTYDQPNEQF